MLYDVNASLQYKFLYLSNIYVLHQLAGIGIFKAAPELHNDEGGPSRLPHNGSIKERAPATITTTKGPASGGAGGVQSRAHGSM